MHKMEGKEEVSNNPNPQFWAYYGFEVTCWIYFRTGA